MLENQKEIFKDVIGYEGLYQVSNFGNVISLHRIVKDKIGRDLVFNARSKAIGDNGRGYSNIYLSKNGKAKTLYIHRLVAEAFISKIPKGMDINHIDGIKSNNNVENLEIVTRKENVIHSVRTGLTKSHLGIKTKDSKSGFSNISVKYVRGQFFWCVCVRINGKRYERSFQNIYEAITIHNQIMRLENKPELVHKLTKEHISLFGSGSVCVLK